MTHWSEFICNVQLIFHTDKDSDGYCKVLSNDSNNKKQIRGETQFFFCRLFL